MEDVEFKNLRNKLLLSIGTIIIFFAPILFFLFKRVDKVEDYLIRDIKKDKNVVIHIYENECRDCSIIKELTKNSEYKFYNIKTDNIYINTILKKLNLSYKDIGENTIIIINKGKVESYFVDYQKKEIKDYLVNNKVIGR